MSLSDPIQRTHVLYRLVREQAERTPDRVAAVYGDQRLSYRCLVDRASRWARRMRRLGVGSEVPVGLHLERDLDLPVLFLAVLEAGGVCVPLEPSYPPEQLDRRLRVAEPPLILSRSDLRDSLP